MTGAAPYTAGEAPVAPRPSSIVWSLVFIALAGVGYVWLWTSTVPYSGDVDLQGFNIALLVAVVFVCVNVNFELLPRHESLAPFVLYPIGFWIVLLYVPLWLGTAIVVGVQTARAVRIGGRPPVLLSNIAVHLPSVILCTGTVIWLREPTDWLGIGPGDIPELLAASAGATALLGISMYFTRPYSNFWNVFSRAQVAVGLTLYLLTTMLWAVWPPVLLTGSPANTEFVATAGVLALNAAGAALAFYGHKRSARYLTDRDTTSKSLGLWRQWFYLSWTALGLAPVQKKDARRQASRFKVLRALLSHSSDGFGTVSADGEIMSWNQTMATWSNIPATDAIGQRLSELLPAQGSGEFVWHPTGSDERARYIEGRLVTLPSASGDPLEELGLFTCRDATEHVRRDQLRNQYVSTVTHELASPLTTIELSAELARDAITDPDVTRILDDVVESAEHMHDLVSDLEVTARIVTLGVENISLTIHPVAAADLVTSGTPASFLRNARMRVDTKDSEVTVHCDLFRGRQIVANLLSNALKYSPPPEPVEVSFHSDSSGGRLRIQVADRGPGLREGEEERVFEPFVRGRDTSHVKGAGIGLATARSLAEAMGGTLSYEVREGGGSAFVLSLPASTTARQPAHPQ